MFTCAETRLMHPEFQVATDSSICFRSYVEEEYSYTFSGRTIFSLLLDMQAVLRAHDAVISKMRPGVSWVDMHK